MEVELKNEILYLRGKTDEERNFLKQSFAEGLRVFGGGSTTTLCLPSKSGLKQVHLEPKQLTMISYALGRCYEDLRRSHGREAVQALMSTVILFKELV